MSLLINSILLSPNFNEALLSSLLISVRPLNLEPVNVTTDGVSPDENLIDLSPLNVIFVFSSFPIDAIRF